ncbi:magnesium transporter MgtE N-terminal domain-containing protein [Wolbachia endosymbiont of Oedothorax gibbosus]|uniref:magnesium transporter MgtE N-terminal domain-containing protein n=1 Tax=Wolbachia endosymbiont of Oedothorax gibbosus TaxID=931100 RepID=UPI00202547AB|nr:MgtE intracellular N domain protein [Wolbachia endosymbiont of Oedothorax gibbosus]
MSGKKHVFKMVPGKTFNKYGTNMIEGPYNQRIHESNKIAKVEFEPLNTKSSVKPELIVEFCSIYQNDHGKMTSSCIKQNQSGDALGFKKEMYAIGKSRHSFMYLNDKLMTAHLRMKNVGDPEHPPITIPFIYLKPIQYKYITWEELGNDARKCYFSDDQGNDLNSQSNDILQSHVFSKEQIIVNDIISSNKEIILSDAFAKTFFKGLTENQLKTLANTLSNEQLQKIIPELSSNQLQVLAKNLTDEQLQALVDHLTNHQLQTLAQELNPEKLQIIVPILNDAQLKALVRDLNPEQVKEILPHLKVDQFKALIKTLNDEQFTVLAKDLAEHHLTILSKELEGDQLKALVNSLQEDQLKDLVNKLDPEKLEAIAQDLTDSNRIQIIIKSLVDNPDKLQAFARNISNEQFKELLDNVGAEELKDIIHKLPYEKVTAVIGDLSNQDQSKAIIDALKGELEEQSKQNKEMIEMLKQIKDDMPEIGQAPDFTIVDINNDSLLFV